MEWYDFTLYGYFASIIGHQFFPIGDQISSLIAAFGVFAAGYMMRPVGSLVFGHIGDKVGRKTARRTLGLVNRLEPDYRLCRSNVHLGNSR
jgi:MHS family proline/betaine transporter-like MFS transporter